jgi:MFS family permease
MKFWRRNYFPLTLIFVAFAFGGMISNGSSSWAPAYAMRSFHMTPGQVGLQLGICILAVSPVGGIAGGWLLNYLTRWGYTDAPLRLGIFSMTGFTIAHVLWPLMPSWPLGLAVYVFGFIFGGMQYIAGAAAAQLVTPPRLRARITAIYFLAVSVIAIGMGPTIVALFTDYLFRDINYVRYSITLTGAIFGPIMIGFVLLARRRYIVAVEHTEASMAGP